MPTKFLPTLAANAVWCSIIQQVQLMHGVDRLRSARRVDAAALMCALWLSTVLVSIHPELHHWLHADSQNGKHECLITQFHKGQIFALSSPAGFHVVPPRCFQPPAPQPSMVLSSADYRLSLSRAPPALLSTQKG